MKYLLFNIGCIECGVESSVVGVFENKSDAEEYGEMLSGDVTFRWKDNGQNLFEVFELPDGCFINDFFKRKAAHE